jgi:hypothetical protein
LPVLDVKARLTVEDLRQLNLKEWRLGPASYFGSKPEWARPETAVLRGIAHPTYDVQKILDALPAYPVEQVSECWAHHMALHAGCHPWPNANHRTAHRGFNLALDRLYGWFVGFPTKDVSQQLIAESHAQRDADGGEYDAAELDDDTHAYRRLFGRYARKLIVLPIEGLDGLAPFGSP